MHFLDTTIPDSSFVDVCRAIVIFLGGATIVYSIHTMGFCLRNGWRWRARWMLAFAVGTLALIQEWEQWQQPMLVWRLPLLALGVAAALIVFRTRIE